MANPARAVSSDCDSVVDVDSREPVAVAVGAWRRGGCGYFNLIQNHARCGGSRAGITSQGGRKPMDKELYEAGLRTRREVLGDEYVDRSLASATPLTQPLQDLLNEYCWGAIWTRPGLPRKSRSLVNVGMITALGKPAELKIHVRGALRNGCTQEEIVEVLLQAAIYCGMPAALEGFRVAREVFTEEGLPG